MALKHDTFHRLSGEIITVGLRSHFFGASLSDREVRGVALVFSHLLFYSAPCYSFWHGKVCEKPLGIS
jgi:hypothetical protein